METAKGEPRVLQPSREYPTEWAIYSADDEENERRTETADSPGFASVAKIPAGRSTRPAALRAAG